MKTAIVTFVRAYNYGAVLQCYALHKTLNKIGVENEVLDYYPSYFYDQYNLSYLGEMRYFPYRPLKNWIKYTPMLWILKRRIKGFEKFISKNIKLSKKQYFTQEEINKENFDYNAYISGSDQVWSSTCAKFDPTFFLDFQSANTAKKISYAASFGVDKIPKEYEDEYKRRLYGWARYSVREKSGQNIVSELLGEKAEQCCDPTILLEPKEWQDICTHQKIRTKYILVYYVNTEEEVMEAAKKLAGEKKLEIIVITSAANYEALVGEKIKVYNAKNKGACSPEEFVSLFRDAQYVISDSFHGTVFSLIFHKKFLTLTDFWWGSKNYRAIELMKIVGVEERGKLDNPQIIDNEIAWDYVDKQLKKYREKSIEYLKNATK